MVRFGCCVGAGSLIEGLGGELAATQQAGYDYGELRLRSLAELSDEDFDVVRRIVGEASIEVLSYNIFVPSTIPVTGPHVSVKDVDDYLKRSLTRAHQLGGRCVVFGSSGARNVPEGFDIHRARGQIDEFLKRCEEHAGPREITITIEPLNRKESNIINTVAEALEIAERLNLPHIKVLADCYHMFLEKESFDIIQKAKDWLAHVHISDGDRYFPGHSPGGGMDFSAFFDALKKSGYDGLISTEAKFDDFESEAAVSNAFTRELWE